MLLWLQSLQIYLVILEMKSDISWVLCLCSQPLTVLTLRLMEEVTKLREFLNVLEKVWCILNAQFFSYDFIILGS